MIHSAQSFPSPPNASAMPRRLANLDLARAIAIAMVIVFHLAALVPGVNGWIYQLTQGGRYGVDLFFVLSGYLVGGLYWREWSKQGFVAPIGFVMRRALRTLPPYLVAMFGSWLIAKFMFGTAFDLTFLLMVQNYTSDISYFKGSWSLCIEEHFYLLLPIILGSVLYWGGIRSVPYALAVIASTSLVARLLTWDEGEHAFGFFYTATHLHFDGLALGVLAAYISHFRPDLAERCLQYRKPIFSIGVGCVLITAWMSSAMVYIFVPAILSTVFTAVIIVLAADKSYGIATARIVEALAHGSYSLYLTHYVAIFFAVAGLQAIGCTQSWQLAVGGLLATLMAGYAFFWLVERPTFWLRDRLLKKDVQVRESNRHPKMSLST